MSNDSTVIHRIASCAIFIIVSFFLISANTLKTIFLKVDPTRKELTDEGYELTARNDTVTITGKTSVGVFYGVQTLRQLLPADIEKPQKVSGVSWNIPEVTIVDTARFPWRGLMVDVGRTFLTKATIERHIDLLAYYKLNRFHWHLTEDQGWRLEIKKYPTLARNGFYTQSDAREVVAYAMQRGIMVIPEIEMPGHCIAALAVFPQLSCTGGPFTLPTSTGPFPDIFCAGNDSVFTFLENVLTEVVDIFPSPLIHIGGDEALKDRWNKCPKCQARLTAEKLANTDQLQSWFIKKIQAFLKTKNREIIGWNDIMQGGGVLPGATVQAWQAIDAGVTVANAGINVIMSPISEIYSWDNNMSSIPLSRMYAFNPVPATVAANNAKYITGAEHCMWGITNQSRLDYFAYPRNCATAELNWTPLALKNWTLFSIAMSRYYTRLANMGIQFYRDPTIPPDTSKSPVLIIPRPGKVQLGSNTTYTLDPTTVIYVTDSTNFAGNYFAGIVAPSTGFILPVEKLSTGVTFKQYTSDKYSSSTISIQHTRQELTIISSGGSSISHALLIDLKGQTVSKAVTRSEHEQRLSINMVPAGSYLLTWRALGRTDSRYVVINK
jgi:hexosaminidase